ncbi:MAG: bacillithiol biosynthesis deacetylase BshB1 [Leadbetterella sp.]|nr:bacillithiol biosynthesis deacetylase BshB1 [Leadbetterella sp.]
MKTDILVFAAHPDDAELGCSATIAKEVAGGKKVVIADLTQGELGTRGSGPLRLQEAAASAAVLQLSARENLGFKDGFFRNDPEHQLEIIRVIRKYQPEIVLLNAPEDRHPDHGRAAQLCTEACFYSGLRRVVTHADDGSEQAPWRPKNAFHYIQDRFLKPDLVVDVSDFWDTKIASVLAFKSQFFDPESPEPASYISSPEFLDFIHSRGQELGHQIGARYGEGFIKSKMLGVNSLFDLL